MAKLLRAYSVILNMNDMVEVKLNDHGREVLKKENPIEYEKYSKDREENILRIHLWDLARIFGKYFNVGADIMFVNNSIEMEVDDDNNY